MQIAKLSRNILRVIIRTDHINDNERDQSLQALSPALQVHGLARVLTTIVDNLTHGSVSAATRVIDDCLMLLNLSFSGPEGYLSLAQALENGLLCVILKCGDRAPSSTGHTHLQSILYGVLPMFMVHYTVVLGIELALPRVNKSSRQRLSQRLRGGKISSPWHESELSSSTPLWTRPTSSSV